MLTSLDDKREPDILFSYYAHYLDRKKNISDIQKDSEDIAKLSVDDVQIDVIELIERPLSEWPSIVDIAITFALFHFASGFFSEMGTDLYKNLKEKIKLLAPKKNDNRGNIIERGIHIIFPYITNEEKINIKIALRIFQLDLIGKNPFTIEAINSFIESDVLMLNPSEVLIMSIDDKPYWKVVYYYNSEGKYISM